MPGWVGPTVALALVVIAMCCAAILAGLLMAGRATQRHMDSVAKELRDLRSDLREALDAVRQVAQTGEELSVKIKEEVQHYLERSRAIRRDLERGVHKVKTRLADLDALYEVVHEEVEDTALEVAAKVRAVRQGAGMVGRLRRWLVRSRR